MAKVDKERFARLLREGKSLSQCARELGVTKGALSQLKKSMEANAKNLPIVVDEDLGSRDLDSIEQLNTLIGTIFTELHRCNRMITAVDARLMEQEEFERAITNNPEVRQEFIKLAAGNMKDVLSIQSNLIALSAEGRKHAELRLKIAETIYNIKYHQEFIAEVLEVIKQASPEMRNKIVKAIKERREVRNMVNLK